MRAVTQRRMRLGQIGKISNALIQRMVRVEIVLGVGPFRAEQIVVQVVSDLTGEHGLPSHLITACAGKALLVAVIDHRVAAGEVHQLVSEPVAGEELSLYRT
jgi:hypothetical protein